MVTKVFILNEKLVENIFDIEGKTLIHKNDSIGEIVVDSLNLDSNILETTFFNSSTGKTFKINPVYFTNLSIKEYPQFIYPKLSNDEHIQNKDLTYYYNEKEELEFIDYYVPFSHQTRYQMSLILGYNINDFSNNINNFRNKTGYSYKLDDFLFEKNIDEIDTLLKKEETVVCVDLFGIKQRIGNLDYDNFIYVDSKNKMSGSLIEKHTKESVKMKTTKEAKRILEKKYKLNKDVSKKTLKNIDYCYIFDDVFTKGNTTYRIKELMNKHNTNPNIKYKIVTYAKTIRYETNDFKRSDIKNNNKKNVLFVCEKNMTRSILAEAIAINCYPDLNKKYNFYSVGIEGYAGRELCDVIYKYLVNNNLYYSELLPQRLKSSYSDVLTDRHNINNNWIIINLEKSIEQKLIRNYNINKEQIKTYHLPDICKYTKPKSKYYEDVNFLVNKIKCLINKEFY